MLKKYRYIAMLIMILFLANSIISYAAPVSEVINMPPTIELSVKPKKKPVDIIILTDYTGSKLASINNQANLLKAKLENVNVDLVFHVINDMKNIGTQKDAIYWYRRYGRYHYTAAQRSNWGSSGSYDRFDVKSQSTVLWEERQSLESKSHTLPKRSPQNVTFSKTGIKREETSSRYREWFDVTIRCSNDIKSSGTTSVTTYQTFYLTGSGFEIQGIYNEYATVDSVWYKEEKVEDLLYDIYSIDFDKLNDITLRDGSDRYIMFISDGNTKDYSLDRGNYFSFGDLSEEVSQYIKNNNLTAIGVVPEGIKDMWLLSDKVTEIEPFITYTNFKLIDGTWKKIGGSIYSSLESGTIAYPDTATHVDNIKNIKKVIGNFVLFKDKSLKIYDQESDTFSNLPKLPAGVTFNNVVDIYSYDSYDHSIYIELDTREVYLYLAWDNFDPVKKLPFMSGYKKTVNSDGRSFLLDKTGRLHYLYFDTQSVYDNNYKYIGTKYTVKYRTITHKIAYDRNYNDVKTLLTSRVKDLDGKFILFEDGDLVSSNITYRWEGKDGDTQVFYIADWVNNYGTDYRLIDTDVSDIAVKDIRGRKDIVFYKKNGDITYKYAGYYPEYYNCRENRDGDWVCSTRYIYKQPAETQIKSFIYLSKYNETLAIDTNNDLHMLTGFNVQTNNVIPTFHKIGSFDLDAVYVLTQTDYYSSADHTLLIKTKSGEAYTFTYYRYYSSDYFNYYFTGSGRGLTKYSQNIRFVKTSPSGQTYLLLEDGTVRGYGKSPTGQLGMKYDYYLRDRDPFVNNYVLTNKTKKYITLNTLFRESLNNIFYPAGQYATAFDDIYKKYEKTSGSGSMYILLGEEIDITAGAYKDRENDPEYQRKWIITHDPNYFDNSMGLSIYHNPSGVNTNPPSLLDKVGKYVINLKVRDNPKNDNRFDNYRLWSTGDQNLTVYVHRKPIALIDVSVTENPDETFTIIATDGGSYDLDHTSRADKGIVEWEWAWRDQWEDSWHYERMNRTDATGDRAYIIALRVKDMEGIWSDWVYQTVDRRQPPIAKFDIAKNPITSVETAQIIDTSYAIMSNLTNWHWIVKKINDNGTIGATLQDIRATESNTGAGGYDTTLDIARTNPGVGRYRIYLRVKADNGLWSDGGTDAAANINNMFYRDLTINQALEIEDISIVGRWNHFRGWTDKFGVYKDVMKDVTYVDEKGKNCYPYRFLSYEKIDISIKLEGYADKVIIDFPDGLDRMTYTDKLGYTYSYREDVGYMVSFPYEIEIDPTLKDPEISWSYILPLVDSTVTWNNIRVKQPYTIRITAIKGTYEVIQEKKIDITGNVDDLIFIQPVAR